MKDYIPIYHDGLPKMEEYKMRTTPAGKIPFGVFLFALVVGLGPVSAFAQVSFDPARNFNSGDGILSVISRDFNNDGLSDMATSNKKTDTVSVHLNEGGGIFLTPWNEYHVGPFPAPTAVDKKPKALPIGVASADFDGDGDYDLVVSNSDADTVSVLLNFGDGTFGPAVDYTVRTDGISPNPGNPENYFLLNPEAVATGDINGDTFTDIVTADIGGSRVSILLGDGLGHFAFPTQAYVGGQPISVVISDFDKDGTQDIATANSGSEIVPHPTLPMSTVRWTVSVLSNLGDGSVFSEVRHEVGSNPAQVIAADLDNNGYLDLVTANHSVTGPPAPNTSWVSVLMNSITGFGPERQIPTDQFPNSVAAGDFDNNGRLDLVVTNDYTGGGFSVMMQKLDGTFQPYFTLSAGATNTPGIVVADNFTDLDIDILGSSKTSNVFALLQNQLTPNPLPPVTLPPTGGVPDLTVTIDKLKAEFKNGETKFEVQVLVNNTGGGTAEGWFQVTAELGGTLLETWNMFSGLQAGTSEVLKYRAPVPIPGSVTGQTLTITVDPVDVILESDETNNVVTQVMN